MKTILIQAGHEGRTSGATGAPGEIETNVRIRNRLAELLISKGIQVQLVNADPPQDQLNKDFDLFLSLHCDADYPNDNGSGFADFPEPSTDGATLESQRICKIINDVYFPETKINYVSHSNVNTKYYYMWRLMSAKTPCVLVEMGQAKDPHDSVLLGNTDLIAGALSKAICEAFGITSNIPTPTPVCPPDLSGELTVCSDKLTGCEIDLANQLAKLGAIKSIMNGKGFWWVKWTKIKALLP
jgi:N-acetylmuramoyl-L-alanine amidase